MSNEIQNSPIIEKYPKIKGKYKSMFGIQQKSLLILHKQIYNLYTNSYLGNLVSPVSFHNIIRNFFVNEYYPNISRNFHTNEKTLAILMGTVAFNMNIPVKLYKDLYTKTDDVDLKIYTTELHYDKSKNNIQSVKNVLSLFKYTVIMLFMYLKQIVAEIIDYSKNIFTLSKPKFKKSQKLEKQYEEDHDDDDHDDDHEDDPEDDHDEDKHADDHENVKHADTKNKIKKVKSQKGGEVNYLIKNSQKNFGILPNATIHIIIKKGSGGEYEEEKYNLTNLSYEEMFSLLSEKITDVDLLITSKIKYNMHYSSLIKARNFLNTFTFSDTKIYYPTLENPTFYSFYLLNNKSKYDTFNNKSNENLTLDNLFNQNININEIINMKRCNKYTNNCNYISIRALQLDLILMLQYAEFINDEEYENNIVVPISALFKYIVYLRKYLKLYMIIKFNNNTLKGSEFSNSYKKLLNYIEKILPTKTIRIPEGSPINLDFKHILNKFHQDFFIKQTMFPEYKVLKPLVDDYNSIKTYINKSRFLFKDVYEKYDTTYKINDQSTILNILKIVFKTKDNQYNQDRQDRQDNQELYGGSKHKEHKTRKFILYNEVNDELNDELNDIYKIHSGFEKSYGYNKSTKTLKNIKIIKQYKMKKTNKRLTKKDKTILIINKIHQDLQDDIKHIPHL